MKWIKENFLLLKKRKSKLIDRDIHASPSRFASNSRASIDGSSTGGSPERDFKTPKIEMQRNDSVGKLSQPTVQTNYYEATRIEKVRKLKEQMKAFTAGVDEYK